MNKGAGCAFTGSQKEMAGSCDDRNLLHPGSRPRGDVSVSPVEAEVLTCRSGTKTPQESQAAQPGSRGAQAHPKEDSGQGGGSTASSEDPAPPSKPQREGSSLSDAGPGGSEDQEQEENEDQQEEMQGEQQQQQQLMSEAEVAKALAQAESLKREGNELFGRGMWDEAAAKYNAAIDAAPLSAHNERAIYFANLAACNIKTQQYAAAVQNCTEAIQLDASYQKAYMRRCEAFERLDELDHALSDAKKLLELSPDSVWARGKVELLQPKVDERTEKLKTEMFSKLKELGNTILGKFGLSTDNFKFDKDPTTGGYNIRFER